MKHSHTAAIKDIVSSKLVKMPQLMLMLIANKHQAGWTTGDLTSITGARPSVITMAKNVLIKSQCVFEQVPQRDQRKTKIYLSDKGRSEAKVMWRALRSLMSAEKSIRKSSGP